MPSNITLNGALILKLIFTLLISAAVGAAGLFIFSKVKKKGFSLEKSLEKAEGAIVKTPKETVAESAPPMEINTEATVETPVETPVSTPEPEVVAPAPIVEAEVVPPVPDPVAMPEPTPEPEVLAPAPNVTHSAMEPAAEKLATDTTRHQTGCKVALKKQKKKDRQ